jgi:hypothetical protein
MAPEKVSVGLFVTEIYGVDLKAGTFNVDAWIWFRAAPTAASPLDNFELMGGRITSRSNIIKKPLPDGQQYYAARITATIHKRWDLHRFPFDNHQLAINIEDGERDLDHLLFVPDEANEGIDPTVAVPGWGIARVGHTLSDHVYHTNYGDTSSPTGAETHWSRYTFTVDLERNGSGRFFKFFFGLFAATLAAFCSFFIRPKDASPRVSVSVGALFAAAAVTIAINNQLPDVGYLTLVDRMVFLTFGMIVLSLFGTVAALWFHYGTKEKAHRRMDTFGAIAFPAVYGVLLFWLLR